MADESLQARVAAALSRIHNPRLENDLLSAGMVRDLTVEEGSGRVGFTFLLSREDPAPWSGKPGPPCGPSTACTR